MAVIPKKIMFAMSDTGGGHRSAAEAISAALDRNHHVESAIVDLLRITDFPVLKKAPEIYDYCSKNHLWLNNFFFRRTNSISRISTLTKMVYFQCRQNIERNLAIIQPDAVVAVHPLVIGLLRLTRKMSRSTWPIITVVTDLVTIHASWATPGADLYLVPTQEAVSSLIKYGIPSSRIIYAGFPIHPKFVLSELTQQQARTELGIEADRFTVLLTGGGVGAGNMNEWLAALENECQGKQILVVTGNNRDLYHELVKRKKYTKHLYVYGFVSNMETLMTASDVVVSKAGPGTIMEGVATNRPLIITAAVGIQETGNIEYIKKNCLGHYCPSPLEACNIINLLAEKAKASGPDVCKGESVITDGSMRIADIILQQLNAKTLTVGPLKQENGNNSLGA